MCLKMWRRANRYNRNNKDLVGKRSGAWPVLRSSHKKRVIQTHLKRTRPWYTYLLSQPINVMVNNMQSRCQVWNQNLYCHCSNKTLNIEKWKCNIVIRYLSVWTRETIVLFCDIKSLRLCQTVPRVIVCSLMIGQHLYTVRIIATCCTWHHFFVLSCRCRHL